MTYESKIPKDVDKGKPENVNGDVDSRKHVVWPVSSLYTAFGKRAIKKENEIRRCRVIWEGGNRCKTYYSTKQIPSQLR
jgi:hypothetical protein